MNNGIYNENNSYGYKLNINNPKINKFYRRFKAWKNIPYSCPLSEKERLEFEAYMIKELNKNQGALA